MPMIGLAEFLGLMQQRDIFFYNERLVDIVLAGHQEDLAGEMVLDAGAGRRINFLKPYLRQARAVVGIDMAYDDLVANIDVDMKVNGSVQTLPFAPGAFGGVISVDVVEHLEDPAAFFHEVSRCLRPGGVMFLCTPNLLGYKNLIARALPQPLLDLAWRRLRGRPRQPHPTYYRANTLSSIRRLAADNGLILERGQYLNEISHFLHPYPALSKAAYLYGHLLERVGLKAFLNYTVSVLRKPATIVQAQAERPASAAAESRRSR